VSVRGDVVDVLVKALEEYRADYVKSHVTLTTR
jgi:hypothetical protein